MIFIVTTMILAGERFFDWSWLRNWQAYFKWQDFIFNKLNVPYLALALTVLPWVIIVVLLNYLLKNAFYGFFLFLFQLAVLFYCLGPRNFWADAFVSLYALESRSETDQQDVFPTSFSEQRSYPFLDNLFLEAHWRLFAVVFWYIIAGVLGAVLYRAIFLSATHAREHQWQAKQVLRWLDWLPIRIVVMLFALGGDFMKVFGSLCHVAAMRVSENEKTLVRCGIAALGGQGQDTPSTQGRNAIHLFDRTLIIVLVILAIVCLVSAI